MGDQVLIGYSCWGFLGPGILDTPDGGRSHRRTLIDGLCHTGHDILFLQRNRDLDEAGNDLTEYYRWDNDLPDIDVLFLEWRWPIPGRNITPCGRSGHTCDLHRQAELLTHYTHKIGIPTIIWDKDRQLDRHASLRQLNHVTVCEPALHPSPGAVPLLFPVADAAIDTANPAALAAHPRPNPLVYVGNQYDRDDAFDTFFAPAAAQLPHLIAGKWPDTNRWPGLNFIGRVPFPQVTEIHANALATVLLLSDRYARVGQITQRIFEAVLAGCAPLLPATIRSAAELVPASLHITDATDVRDRVGWLAEVAGTNDHADLIAACLRRLAPFRLSTQLAVLDDLLRHSGRVPS
ncbi:hypothetical protein [Plantactinospora sp. KLBMP9567]|uniref:hypothetical protein n=1 Tax=Plantactinospora sp. KLBMP9567 TaxID=3085900 RepID=UPI002981AFD4|nr:hypothetical protein [Plantactinospora sp. KLBMP9567]MDW5325731.1 hypothetical protein [Plantactinospora sp. KLBMP9567]